MKSIILLLLFLYFANVPIIYSQDVTLKNPNSKEVIAGLNLSGSFQKVLNNTSEKGSEVTEGSIGFKVNTTDVSVNSSITIASTNDTVRSDYGANLLIPKKGVSSFYINLNIKKFLKKWTGDVNIDYYFTGSVSTSIWSGKEDSLVSVANNVPYDDSVRTVNVNNLSLSTGISYNFFRGAVDSTNNVDKFLIVFGGGFTVKSVTGDIGLPKNNALLESLIGSKNTWFPGFELFGILGFKDFSVSANYTHIFGKKIQGLENGKLLINTAFSLNLVERVIQFPW